MGKTDKRVDAYIAKAEPFAQPILKHIRELVHEACPDVEETLKWGMPHFDYMGIMCAMAAFKKHAVMGFWKASLMKDKTLQENAASESAMGHLGRITSMKDLPSDKVIKAYVQEAMELNENGIKVMKPRPVKAKKLAMPSYFKKAIDKNKKASKVFAEFSQSKKNDYIDWVTEAKSEATRDSRVKTAVEWIAEGKGRNWKYEKK